MLRIAYIVFFALLVAPCISDAKTIDVLIKGVDDGVKTNKQQDYKEAVMNAKLQAIERAGVEIKSITKVVNFQMKFDVVEAKAKAALLQGYRVMDMGYQTDGSYQVILSGKVQTGGNSGSSKVVSKVVDQLLNLLTDKSPSATEKIKLTLSLLPDDFDYNLNKLIMKARIRVLKHDIKFELKQIPKIYRKPERIIIGKGPFECTSLWERELSSGWFFVYRKWFRGTYIIYDDGSKSEIEEIIWRRMHLLRDALGVTSAKYVTKDKITRYYSDSSSSIYNRYVEYTNDYFQKAMERHEQSLQDARKYISHIKKAETLSQKLTRLTDDEDTKRLITKLSKIRNQIRY